jgi:hypothetical protein
VFTATSKNGTLSNDIWICDSGACGHYCKSTEGMFNVSDIDEKITVGNGNSMTATKVESLKHHVAQLDGSVWTSQSTKLSMFLSYVLISSASTRLLMMHLASAIEALLLG